MTQEVENQDAAAGLENPESLRDGSFWMHRVMQRLTKEGDIDLSISDRNRFDIAEAVLEIRNAMFSREIHTELDHLRRIVHRDDVFRMPGEQLREGALPCPQIRDHERRQEVQERFRKA